MEKEKRPSQKELAYYLTVFTIEGHTTYRSHLGGSISSFSDQLKNNEGKHPKITSKKLFRIDRITGVIEEL